ncbi:MAG: sugar phosphate isomerase/epimerase family protein [Planctomycetota bacterium]|jgi:sugar phosphate isomerase/epimerase
MISKIDRRNFLKLTGAAAAALTAVSCTENFMLDKKENEKWQMKLSTSSIQFRDLTFEQACQKIAKLGFEAIDIWSGMHKIKCEHLNDAEMRLGADGIKELLAKNNLKLAAVTVYHYGYTRYAKLLGELGGGVSVEGSDAPCEPKDLVPKMRHFLEGLKPAAETAEKYNSYIAIENHGNALLDSIDSIKTFVDINKSSRLGIALAPYHIQARGESVAEAIEACGEKLFFFYAWQKANGAKQFPGIGPTDVRPWLKALAKINYPRYVNPFMHGHPSTEVMAADLAKSRQYLINCYNEIIKDA